MFKKFANNASFCRVLKNQNLPAGYGVRSDGKILFINASTCDINYLPCNPPVVFDVTIPPAEL